MIMRNSFLIGVLMGALLCQPQAALAVTATNVGGGTTLSDSASLRSALSDETGTGLAVFATSPTFTTPILGTPTSGTLTNCTGLPAAGVTGTAAILGANTFTATQTITQASANAGIVASTGYSLTGSNATNMIDLAGTWNTSGTPTAIKLNITNTASNASSLLMDMRVDNASKFQVTRTGGLYSWGNARFINVYSVVGADPSAASAGAGFHANADGVMQLQNWNIDNFDRLQFGGTTSSFPALKRSSATLQVVLANDGGYATLSTGDLIANGAVNFSTGSLEIATGVVTATKSYHTIDTEASAASDDLDTISGGVAGDILVINAANSSRTVVVKDGTGNLQLEGDCTLDNTQDTIMLIYTSAGAWYEVSRSNNGA